MMLSDKTCNNNIVGKVLHWYHANRPHAHITAFIITRYNALLSILRLHHHRQGYDFFQIKQLQKGFKISQGLK